MISELRDKLLNLSDEISTSISQSNSLNDLEEIRVNSLGKKGLITSYLKNLREYDEVSKREIGALVNDLKNKINKLIIEKKGFFKTEILNEKLITEKIDVTPTPHENNTCLLYTSDAADE